MSLHEAQQHRQSSNPAHYADRLLPLLQEPDVLDIVTNADGSLWVNRLGRGFEREGVFPPSRTQLLLNGIATIRQIQFDHEHPLLETIFPLTGDRIQGLIPPVVSQPVFAIRTRPKKIYRLNDSADSGILTKKHDALNSHRHHDDFMERAVGLNHLEVLRLACRYRRNFLLVGPTGSGKTAMANGIIAEWQDATPDDRVVIIEDTPELQCSLPNHLQLLATARILQSDLLVASMRLIPHRIVVGEVREEEPARVLLGAWNTGHSGGLATIHGNDALKGLRKLETLIGGHRASVREQIASAIDVVIFIDREQNLAAGRKVREVLIVRSFDQTTQDYAVEYV